MKLLHLVLTLCSVGLFASAPAMAACTLPYNLTNGQPADATQVMGNMNALANCIASAPAGATNAIQYNAGSGTFGAVGPLTNGQIVIGSTGGVPVAGNITAGTGISIANIAGGIVISATGGGGGAAPVLVQSAFSRVTSGSTGSVTLPAAPTVGNLLVAIATGFDNPTSMALGIPSGFNTTFADRGAISVNQGIVVGVRVVESGDGTTWSGFTGGNGGDNYAVLELSGAHAIEVSAIKGAPSGVAWPFFSGRATLAYSLFVLESDATNSYSSITGGSLVFDGTNTAGNHPAVFGSTAAGTAANGSVTYTGSSFGNTLFAAITVIP